MSPRKEGTMQISKMRSNINELVDFEKLKKCNDICFKWSQKFKIKKNHFAKFMWSIFKNPEKIHPKLKQNQKEKFIEDCKTMFYAAEVENILIEQYSAMVYNIMKRMRVSYDNFDEYVTDGFMAVRSAVWQYRTYKIKASFTTYAHKSIFMRIRGKLHKEKLKRLKNKFTISCESDYESKEFNLENINLRKDYSANLENIDDQITELSKKCSLSEQETMLLISFANRRIDVPTWYEQYRQKYINPKTKVSFSRQSVYNHLAAAHEKVFFYLQQTDILPKGYKPPKKRRGDFR